MIKSFKCKETKKVWNEEFSKKLPNDIQSIALRKLIMLHSTEALSDLKRPPKNKLENLQGNRKGQHSIRINEQYRICFVWLDKNAYDVEIIDYHK